MENILFIDLETTGINLTHSRICQVGVLYKGKEYNLLVNPQIPIPDDASRIHGIRDEDVVNAPTFSKIGPKLLELINDCDAICGYNYRKYDAIILQVELLRHCGIDCPKKTIIDVYEHISDVWKSKKLKDVYYRLIGEEILNAHDALADIQATKKVYEHLINSIYK